MSLSRSIISATSRPVRPPSVRMEEYFLNFFFTLLLASIEMRVSAMKSTHIRVEPDILRLFTCKRTKLIMVFFYLFYY